MTDNVYLVLKVITSLGHLPNILKVLPNNLNICMTGYRNGIWLFFYL